MKSNKLGIFFKLWLLKSRHFSWFQLWRQKLEGLEQARKSPIITLAQCSNFTTTTTIFVDPSLLCLLVPKTKYSKKNFKGICALNPVSSLICRACIREDIAGLESKLFNIFIKFLPFFLLLFFSSFSFSSSFLFLFLFILLFFFSLSLLLLFFFFSSLLHHFFIF